MPDSKLLWFLSTERMSVQVEGHTFVPDDEGYIAVPENLGTQIKHPTFQYVGRERPNKKSIEPYRPVASVGPISDAAARTPRSAAPAKSAPPRTEEEALLGRGARGRNAVAR